MGTLHAGTVILEVYSTMGIRQMGNNILSVARGESAGSNTNVLLLQSSKIRGQAYPKRGVSRLSNYQLLIINY